MDTLPTNVAVVIPSYKVKKHILGVISAIGPECSKIYVIDDCCPERSGEFVKNNCADARVQVISHVSNGGVGAAVLSGYRQAVLDGMEIIVKIDGDGQMDPSLLMDFVEPIMIGDADYTKGNRFYNLSRITQMPKSRIFGNAALSFMSKFSTGYWNLFDPTNGYTAIHCEILKYVDTESLSPRYFFETDMLFRLNIVGAKVVDVPMDARYGDEISNLKISSIFTEFLAKHSKNLLKRIFYNYYLRDMSVASLELFFGVIFFTFGAIFSFYHWIRSMHLAVATPVGTIVVGMLCLLTGLQLLLAFVTHDVESVPKLAIHKKWKHKPWK